MENKDKIFIFGSLFILFLTGLFEARLPRQFDEIRKNGSLESLKELNEKFSNQIDLINEDSRRLENTNERIDDLLNYLNLENIPHNEKNKYPENQKLRKRLNINKNFKW